MSSAFVRAALLAYVISSSMAAAPGVYTIPKCVIEVIKRPEFSDSWKDWPPAERTQEFLRALCTDADFIDDFFSAINDNCSVEEARMAQTLATGKCRSVGIEPPPFPLIRNLKLQSPSYSNQFMQSAADQSGHRMIASKLKEPASQEGPYMGGNGMYIPDPIGFNVDPSILVDQVSLNENNGINDAADSYTMVSGM